jgi:2-C-methyl-D-erythritol 4-phosphate cytidylyltransferase
MSVAAIVAAAGRGERLGAGGPKALQALAGSPMLVHAVRALAAARGVEAVVVAAPPDLVTETRDALGAHHDGAALVVVAGGSTRPASVRAALSALPPGTTTVLVHDAARPLAPVGLVEAVVAAVAAGAEAVVPGVPVVDTVKQVADGVVVATLDRAALRAVQTPQGFRREVLERAHAGQQAPAGAEATDDAGLVERLGVAVTVVPGHEDAFKVTRPIDLLLAEAVLARREASGAR